MAAALQKKPSASKGNGGVSGAIVPPRKQVDQFPLMTYVAKNCSFDDVSDDSSLENEDALKAANDRRLDELLSKATLCATKQSKASLVNDDAERKKALEVLHGLESARNQEDTWKVSEPKTQKKNFLHPLVREKDSDYYSGVTKVKPVKERKRCRSDEVVLLDNGKLVPKHGLVDYSESSEVAQLPLKFNMPLRSKPPRVPSVGLPFTPGPPLPIGNNPWMQKSGTELFSQVQSQTLLVNGGEDADLARAIAESIRTAKEEQQRTAMLETLYQSQCKVVSTTKCDQSVAKPQTNVPEKSWESDWEEKPTPSNRNRSVSVDRRDADWDTEKTNPNCNAQDTNNNNQLKKSVSSTQLSKDCLEQRSRHMKEEKTSKSPPPPMLVDLAKSVSDDGKVITLKAPEIMKNSSQLKPCEDNEEKEDEHGMMMNGKQMPENGVVTFSGVENESSQRKVIPRTSHVPETFDNPKITSIRLPTSQPSALMTAMKNFTQPSKVKAKQMPITSSPDVPPLLIPPKEPTSEEENHANRNLSQNNSAEHFISRAPTRSTTPVATPELSIQEEEKLDTCLANRNASHNDVGHVNKRAHTRSRLGVPPPLVTPTQASHKMELEQLAGGESLNLPSKKTDVDSLNSTLKEAALTSSAEISTSATPSQPHISQPASLPPMSQEALLMAQQAQVYQMLMLQQSMGCIPQVLQNGQNFGGMNGKIDDKEKLSEKSPADVASASMSLPQNLSSFMPGLSNPYPGILAGLPNPIPGNLPGLTNPVPGNLPGNLHFPGNFQGLTNPVPGILPGTIPGLGNPLQAAMPNLQNLPGSLPDTSLLTGMPPFVQHAGFAGFTNGYPGSVTSHNNLMPSNLGGFSNAALSGFQMNPLLNMQGLQSNMPSGYQTPVSSSLTGIPNCNSFGGMAQSLTPQPAQSFTAQPGSGPLMGGRGRGRLANATALK